MAQEEGPKGPEYTTVTVQEPLRRPQGPRVQESLLAPGSPPEKAPVPGLHCCHKQTDFQRRVPIALLLAPVIALLILTVVFLEVSLAVRSANQLSDERGQTAGSAADDRKDGEVLPPCDEDWIWYRNKCYYFSEAEGSWMEAKDSCAALNSSLAMIDNQKELDFMMRHKGDRDHWIGLWRDSDMLLRWINGTEFNKWFTVEDYSDYAYLNHHRVKSGDSYNTRNWICNKVSTYEKNYKREKTVASFH